MANTVPELTSDPVGSDHEKLVWKSYATEISHLFSDYMKGGEMVDTTLITGGHKILVHKMVLSATSSFMKKILTEIDCSEPCIILPSEVNIDELSLLVDFMYKGEIKFLMSQLPSLSKLAQMLGIPGLPGFTEAVFAQTSSDKDEEKVTWIVEEDTQDVEVFEEGELQEMDDSGCSDSLEVPMESPSKQASRNGGIKRTSGTYSSSNLEEGFKLLQCGKSIGQASRLSGVPRTTLYNKAKSCGVILKQDKEVKYTSEQMEEAVKAVIGGQSLKSAADMFGVSKTALWRRSQGLKPSQTISKKKQICYSNAQKMAAVDALKSGERTRKVAQEFGIPPATLYREKLKLMDSGVLPKGCIKKRSLEDMMDRQIRVQQAVSACKEGKMSQSSAASHYEVPKTTIWRRLRKMSCNSKPDEDSASTSMSSAQKENEADYTTFVIDGTNLKLISEDDAMSMGSPHYIVLSGSEADSLPSSLQVMLPQNEEGSVVCEVEELAQEVDMETINESGGKS